MRLTSPNQLTELVESLTLSAEERFDLNRRMANRARQFFRQQIRAQRDIDDNPYKKRRRQITILRDDSVAQNTVNAKNMLMGISKGMRTHVTKEGFSVGLSGLLGKIGRTHNEGNNVSFTTRVNGFYNSRTGQWEGCIKVKENYEMPTRTFIGWTHALEIELLAMAAEQMMRGTEN